MAKNLAGRPRLFDSPQDMQKRIDEYFDTRLPVFHVDNDGKTLFDKFGNPIIKSHNAPSVHGMFLFLGFSSYQSFDEYKNYAGFSETVSRAKARIAQFYEENLTNPNVRAQGPIFAMDRMLNVPGSFGNGSTEFTEHKGLLAGLLAPEQSESTEPDTTE